jgi:hypothetical protein
MLESICLFAGNDLESQIAKSLEGNLLKKEKNYRKFICAFTAYQEDLIRLRFDKMMLRFVYYPLACEKAEKCLKTEEEFVEKRKSCFFPLVFPCCTDHASDECHFKLFLKK